MAHRFLSIATALALVLSAKSAAALTAEEAWAAVQAMSASGGQTITTESVTQDGDTLTVTGFAVGSNAAQGTAVSAKMASMVFQDQGDGTVKITYAPSYDINFTLPGSAPDESVSYSVAVTTDQIETIASGSVDAPVFDFTASTITVSAKDFVRSDGKPMDLSIEATLSDASGKYLTQMTGTGADIDGKMAVGLLDMTIVQADSGNSVNGTVKISDLVFQGKNTSVDQAVMQAGSLPALLAAGFAVESQMTSGPVTLGFDVSDQGTAGRIDASFSTTSGTTVLNEARMDYALGLTGGALSGTGFDMPLPEIASAFGEVAFGWSMPMKPSEEPQEFAFLLKLVDLTLTEGAWAIFDAGQQLPRDPVTFITDLKGTGAWDVNIFDTEAMGISAPEVPGKLFSLDLTQVLIRAVGAQVGAVGGLTFDNEMGSPIRPERSP